MRQSSELAQCRDNKNYSPNEKPIGKILREPLQILPVPKVICRCSRVTRYPALVKALFKASANATERCLPPVQPMAIDTLNRPSASSILSAKSDSMSGQQRAKRQIITALNESNNTQCE